MGHPAEHKDLWEVNLAPTPPASVPYPPSVSPTPLSVSPSPLSVSPTPPPMSPTPLSMSLPEVGVQGAVLEELSLRFA